MTLVILMKVAINCNYGASQHWDAFAEASRAAYDGMDETSVSELVTTTFISHLWWQRERVKRRVQVGSDALPVNPSCDTMLMVYSLLEVEVSYTTGLYFC